MPKTRAAKLTAKEKKKYFLKLYAEKGAVEDQIPYCERRAHLKPGAGRSLLKRKWAQADLAKRTLPAVVEHVRTQVLPEAAKLAGEQLQETLKAAVDKIVRMKIEPEILEHELMAGVIGLDWNRFPKEKLDVIKAAYVVNGTMESGNSRRIIPAEGQQTESGAGIYTSLFNRLALEPQGTETKPDDKVYDLFPQPVKSASVPMPALLPPPGESIEEKPVAPKETDSRVITVEVG